MLRRLVCVESGGVVVVQRMMRPRRRLIVACCPTGCSADDHASRVPLVPRARRGAEKMVMQ